MSVHQTLGSFYPGPLINITLSAEGDSSKDDMIDPGMYELASFLFNARDPKNKAGCHTSDGQRFKV